MAWIDSLDETSISLKRSFLKMIVNCPVDIYVYDNSDNLLLGKIINNQVIESEGIVSLVDNNGQKIVYLPKDGEYRVICKASDDGKMSITTALYEDSEQVPTKLEYYQDLVLRNGEEYIYNSDINMTALRHNENDILPTVVQKGEDIDLFSVMLTEEGNGNVVGNGAFLMGEKCRVKAFPDDGESFLGWYQNNKLVCKDEEYQFSVKTNVYLTAKFTCSSACKDYDKKQKQFKTNKSEDEKCMNCSGVNTLQFSYKGNTYCVLNDKEAALVLAKQKRTVTVPNMVKYNGTKLRVTVIKRGSIKGNKKIRKLILGKYIKRIEKKACYNCKKLKRIVIKSDRISFIEKKAFVGISKRAVIKTNKKSKSKLRKKIIASGVPKSVKIL